MRNKYVTEYKGCTIEVIGENDFMYRIIKRGAKGQRMDLFVDMFYRSTSDALKGAMRWIDNNVRKEQYYDFWNYFCNDNEGFMWKYVRRLIIIIIWLIVLQILSEC